MNFSGGGEVLKDLQTEENDLKVGDDYVSCFSIGDLGDLPSGVCSAVRNEVLSTDVRRCSGL